MATGDRALLLLSQTFSDGGIQRFNRTLLAASRQTPPRVDVLSLRDPPDAPAAARTGIGLLRGFQHRRGAFALATWRALASGRYRVVVIGHINLLMMALLASCLTPFRPRMLLIAHGVEVWTGVGGPRRWALRRMDRLLCVSRYTERMIQRQAPELPAAVFTIFPNALGETWQRGAPVVADTVPASDAWPKRFLLAVARIEQPDRTKGIVTTIEALATCDDDTLQLVVAGSGGDLAFLRGVAARCGVSDRVHFAGRVTDEALRELYARCIAFVLPSGQEGFGIVFLEAMYFGAPVIAARAKGAVDVIEDGVTGLLVDYGDIAALARAIDRIARDKLMRTRLRNHARIQVVEGGAFNFGAYQRRWHGILASCGVRVAEALPP